MSAKQNIYPLIEAPFVLLKWPWYLQMALFALLLFVPPIVGAYSVGIFANGSPWDFWRVSLQNPVMILYILAIYPITKRMDAEAIKTAVSLFNSEPASRHPVIHEKAPVRRLEWLSVFVAVSFVLTVSQPWKNIVGWFEAYILVSNTILLSLLALVIYYSFRDMRYLTQINKKLEVDIFNIEAFLPLARRGLGSALIFTGGIILSVLFQTTNSLMHWQTMLVYGILIGATVLIFYVSIWSTHAAMARIKNRELAFVSKRLLEASKKLKQISESDSVDNDNKTYHEIAAWQAYKNEILEVREWPLNTSIMSRLVLSVLSPIVIYLIKVILGVRIPFFGYFFSE